MSYEPPFALRSWPSALRPQPFALRPAPHHRYEQYMFTAPHCSELPALIRPQGLQFFPFKLSIQLQTPPPPRHFPHLSLSSSLSLSFSPLLPPPSALSPSLFSLRPLPSGNKSRRHVPVTSNTWSERRSVQSCQL